ncbi:MAG: hypothetical protein ACXWCP_26915 [Burkholderiales bacterium]
MAGIKMADGSESTSIMRYFASEHAQLGSLLPEPFVHLADWPPWHVILQSLPASFLALHELVPPVTVASALSLDCGVLLGPHAERKKINTATEYFIVSTPSAYSLQLQDSTEPSLYR